MKTSYFPAILALILAGCSKPEEPPPPPKVKLFAPEREALDKAKTVEQTVKDQAEQQKQDIDKQTE